MNFVDNLNEIKICPRCKLAKPWSEFGKRSDSERPKAYCSGCEKSYQTNRYINYSFEDRLSDRAKRYGITLRDYLDLIDIQGSRCAACNDPLQLGLNLNKTLMIHLDHDHTTGRVRGILCHSCNLALGHAKDSIERLRGLIDYLERFDAAS